MVYDKLNEWSTVNQVKVIKTDLPFRVGTGELDDLCFDEDANKKLTLSRLGVFRLLNTITKQYPDTDICISREEMKKAINPNSASNVRRKSFGTNNIKHTDQ